MTERKPPQYTPSIADRIGSWIDRAVYAMAPERGIRRMAIRRQHEQRSIRAASSKGAESTRLKDGKWLGSRLSPDSAAEMDLDRVRQRSRELYESDSIGGVVDSRTNLVVSYGFTPQARIKERAGLATDAQAKQWNAELEEVYKRLGNKISKSGKQTLWQLLRLVEKHHGFDGGSITIISDRGESDKPIPLTLEVVDPTRLETPPGMVGNPLVRMGVEYDKSGRIVAYHIRKSHPQDTRDVDMTYTRYPAERVLHVFDPWFAGQSREKPWMSRTIDRCRDVEDLDDAAITAAQVEACFAAFVTSSNAADAASGAATEVSNGRQYQDIRPGTIQYIDPIAGEDVKFSQPTKSNGYSSMQEWHHHRIAAGIDFPYEMVTKNWSGTSFSGGRLALTSCRQFVMVEQKLLTEAWLCAVWNRIVEESVIVGACTIPPAVYARDPWWFQQHEWRAPAWPFALTPGEEIKAKVDAINNNLITKASVIGEMGGDREEVFEERRRECEDERQMGIEPAVAEASVSISPQQTEQQQEQGAAA